MSKKERVPFFEKEIFTDVNYAKQVYEREEGKFKFKAICTGASAIGTALFYLFGLLAEYVDIFNDIALVPLLVAIVAAVLTGPTMIFKFAHKTGKLLWFITPIIFADLVMYVFGYWIALVVLVFAPVLFALYNLYLSYINRKAAQDFLGVAATYAQGGAQQSVSSQIAVTQGGQGAVQQPAAAAVPAPQPQVYRCPTCSGTVVYGAPACKNCGTAFNWG